MLRDKKTIGLTGEGVRTTSPSAEDTRSSQRASPAHRASPAELRPGAWVRISSGCHFGRKARVEAIDGNRATITINWDVPLSMIRQITVAIERLSLLLPRGVNAPRDERARPDAPSASARFQPHRL